MLAFECDQQVQTARGRSVHARRLLQLHASHDSLAGGFLSLLPQGPVCRHSSHSLLAGATPAKREIVTWVLAEMGVATLLLLATSRLQTPTVTPATPTAPAPVAAEAEAEAEAEAVMIVVTIAATVATAMTAMTAVVTTMIVMTMTVAVMITVMIAIVAVMTATVVTTATAETLIEILTEILTEILIITTMIVMSAETAATSPATIASAAPVRRWTSPRLRRLLQFLRRIAVFSLHTNSVTCRLG